MNRYEPYGWEFRRCNVRRRLNYDDRPFQTHNQEWVPFLGSILDRLFEFDKHRRQRWYKVFFDLYHPKQDFWFVQERLYYRQIYHQEKISVPLHQNRQHINSHRNPPLFHLCVKKLLTLSLVASWQMIPLLSLMVHRQAYHCSNSSSANISRNRFSIILSLFFSRNASISFNRANSCSSSVTFSARWVSRKLKSSVK